MDKRKVIERIREEFQLKFRKLKRASDSAREDATDAESKAKSKYDTQGLEASYLAAGQAERAEDLAIALQAFGFEPFPPFPADARIAEGALVEADFGGDIEWFLLAPSAGGMTIEMDGQEVTILGPNAPLRQKLTGQKAGKRIKEPNLLIKSVR
jgi:hypothetical protein